MSIEGETKAKILSLLEWHKMKMIDISKEIGVCNATIWAHLQDLVDLGLIRQVENIWYKKDIFYEVIE